MKLRALVAVALAVVGLAAAPSAAAPSAAAVTSGDLTWHPPHSIDPPHGGLASVSCSAANSCRAGTADGPIVR